MITTTKNLHFKTLQSLILIFIFSSCMAPVNLNFESASMLEKGEKDRQVSGSYYYIPYEIGDNKYVETQINIGGKLGFGISDKYNIKAKIEVLIHQDQKGAFFLLEMDNKIRLSKWAAVSLPVGVYVGIGQGELNAWPQFDPRFYLTYAPSNKFELTVIPKVHIYSIDPRAWNPGLSLGAGFSKDLNLWSIRPEIGYDQYAFSAGVSFTKLIGGK